MKTRALAAGFALSLGLTAAAGALQDAGEPTLFRPSGRAKSGSLPRGEVLLFQILQTVADATGIAVCYKGTDPPDKTIHLARAVDALDARAAAALLGESGYDMSSATYRGKQVHWVQKLIVPPRQKGRIIRQGERSDADPPAAEDGGAPGPEPAPSLPGTLTLYQRESGAGARFVVSFETDSRAQAEEALSLLKAHQRSRAAKSGK